MRMESCVDDVFFFSSRRRHTRFDCDWSSDVCSSDLTPSAPASDSAASIGGTPVSIDSRGNSCSATALCTSRPARSNDRNGPMAAHRGPRSEEHTSELQSQSNLVCRLLLEKKKINRELRYISNKIVNLFTILQLIRSQQYCHILIYQLREHLSMIARLERVYIVCIYARYQL